MKSQGSIMHKTTVTFWKCFNDLPENIKKISREQFSLFSLLLVIARCYPSNNVLNRTNKNT